MTVPQQGQRGFSLVELLVVLGIIAVLAGLTAGVAIGARGAGYKANCLSNLRQIGAAIHIYIADHATLPLAHYRSSGLSWGEPPRPPPPPPDHTIYDCLYPYARSKALFVCPAQEWLAHLSPDGLTYSYNKGASGLAITDVRVSDSRALLMWDKLGRPAPHFGKFNCLFLDGHVKGYRSGEIWALWIRDERVDWPPR